LSHLLPPKLSISIVSHDQSALVSQLLEDLVRLSPPDIEVLLTANLPEDENAYPQCPFPVRFIRNAEPKGFGANHNAAFHAAQGRYFAVVNPDIRLPTLNLDGLLALLEEPSVAAVAPVVLSAAGTVEDSVRRFPTFGRLARRVLLKQRAPGYRWDKEPIEVDWAAGMFIVFRSEAYQAVGGFDDRRYFMYFEDVDICARLRKRGARILLQPQTSVIHDARRDSHRSLKHLRWHLTSAARYLTGF
jgi:N-acetylglucosaminyl-diphospho-decaprenol L-rhamnosyltransferase